MKVLVTGAEGYIGHILRVILVSAGYDITGLDTGYYREGWLYTDPDTRVIPRNISKDLRRITEADLQGYDTVIHLAELSNDPLGEYIPEITFDINHKGSVALAAMAKAAGVSRFIYTSSCSVYGVADGVVDEKSKVNPLTSYAKCKVLVEKEVSEMADSGFSPVFLRNATAYGASPRMRFDIVLNNLAGSAWTTRTIAMTSDGSPWRPLVHVRDICKAIQCVMEAPVDAVHAEIFNVGSTRSNYQIREIAEIIAEVFSGCELSFGPSGNDDRSYQVNFDKILRQLPGFQCDWNARKGAEELKQVFERVQMSPETFDFRPYTRLKALSHLQETGQINSELYWSQW